MRKLLQVLTLFAIVMLAVPMAGCGKESPPTATLPFVAPATSVAPLLSSSATIPSDTELLDAFELDGKRLVNDAQSGWRVTRQNGNTGAWYPTAREAIWKTLFLTTQINDRERSRPAVMREAVAAMSRSFDASAGTLAVLLATQPSQAP